MRLKPARHFLGYLSILLLIAACDQASDTVINIPSVALECDSATYAECSSANSCSGGTQAIVQMSRSGCGSSVGFEPVATGSVAMSCDAQGCAGVVGEWTDANTGEPLQEIISGRMDICTYIDFSCNGAESSGDLINETSQSLQGGSTVFVDSWEQQ